MASPTPLFPTSLVSAEVQTLLETSKLHLRPLQRDDYANGHMEVLRDLAFIGDISEEQWVERFDWMSKCGESYFILIIEDEQRGAGKTIVGTGTLVIEKKFLNNLGVQGHIEDIAIKSEFQGRGLGVKLIQALDHIAEQVGCYKTILDCRPDKEGFYEKCGYEKRGTEMHRYCDASSMEHSV